ncbi:MAG: glycosyltransferase [bacterium]|nr:glycosyltransferase [bacterium]
MVMMKKILQVYPQMNNAGTEMVIMNLYRNIDRSKVSFDFLTQKPGSIDAAIRAMGGKIYYIPNTGKSRYYKELLKFFKEHSEYTAIHTHTHAEMGLVMKAAKTSGIKHRIAHSHNSREDLPVIFKLYKRITGIPIERNANHFFACSELAAKWLFPSKWRECKILENAIELERFVFDNNKRMQVRNSFGFDENDKIICHVGRFAEQKNHKRIIELLNKMTKEDKHIKAILVGEGPLFKEIQAMSKSENIMFLGSRTDVPEILCAADMFLFPSLHEGLGIVLIEAQASGLKCVASDAVPPEADIGTGLLTRMSLKENDSEWIKKIKKSFEKSDRSKLSKAALNSKYNIKTIGKYIEEYYLGLD